MIKAWGSYTFTFYACLDIIMAVLVFVFLKETRGRSIEEMETIFNSNAKFDVQIARDEGARGKGIVDTLEHFGVHEQKT